MNTTAHPVPPEEVMALLDGELSADRAQSVSAHIETCAECHQVAASLSNTSQSLAGWSVLAAPANPMFEDRLANSAKTATISRDDSSSSLRKLLRVRLPFVWGAAALAVLVVVMIGLSSRRFAQSVQTSRTQALLSEKAMREVPLPPAGEPVSVDTAKAIAIDGGLGRFDNGTLGKLQERAEQKTSDHGWLQPQPMIARTVSLSIIVKDFDSGRASLDAILARHDGYAATLNVSTPQGAARTLQASLRIPAPRLASALGELKALGRVEAETQNGEEVTQQHTDLVARLKNSRETEQRLQDVLRTRTGKVKEVLEVEQEIARVRGEIEQMEAEQQTLEHRVDFATVDLKLAEEYKAQLSSPTPSVSTQIRNSCVTGFRNAFESLLALILFLAEAGPAFLLWSALLLIPAWRLWRRYQRVRTLGSSLSV